MIEIWKSIKKFWGYEASNLGRVRSIDRSFIRSNGWKHTRKGQMLRAALHSGYPYLRVMLSVKNKHYYVPVHRLVAFAFLGEPPSDDYEVNHKDGDKLNNNIENLEWMTHQQNSEHAVKVLKSRVYKKGQDNHLAKLRDSQIRELRRKYKTGNYFQHDLAKMFGITREYAGRLLRGEYRLLDNRNIHVAKQRLKKEDVIKIRQLHNNGFSKVVLSAMFGVETEQIRRIILNLAWRNAQA